MSDTDSSPFEILDLIEADRGELAQFATRHHVALEQLERCQRYLKSAARFDGGVEVWAYISSSGTTALVIRHRRPGFEVKLKVPRDFPTEDLLRLVEIIHET